MAKARVVLVDDHKLMIEALRAVLESDGDFEIVAWTTEAVSAPNIVAELSPDIVVLDWMMPALDGITCMLRIRQRSPEVKVVMLSASDDDRVAELALNGGADAFVGKQIDPRDLPGVLRQVLNGKVTRTGSSGPAKERATASGLSERELDVLGALASGLSNQQIAQKLFVSEQTVKFHLSNIYRKLGARNRTEAVRIAVASGFVENPIFGQLLSVS